LRLEEAQLAPLAPAVEDRPERRRLRSGLAPWTICFLLGAWAAAGSLLLFPDLTNNNDEAVYLLQADALRHGHLFPPAPASWEAFLPWFGFHDGGRFVLKYTPVHAAVIAAARSLFGSDRAALAIIGAAAAATSYLLARQVLRDRGQATLAAALFALSPLVLIQSATFLSYLSALALMQGFAAALILGIRTGSPRWLAGAGFLLGVGLFARPYDALLFAAPLGLWAVWIQRHDLRAAFSSGAWVTLGSALPLISMLAFFYAATGNPFDSPFDIDPSDTLGFGPKSMTPGGLVTDYTPALALAGLKGNLAALVEWSFGGLALLALAIAALPKLRPREPAPWLALIALTVPIGYLFFWGSYGTVRWGGTERLGPHYYLPLITPLAILGARGLFLLRRRSRVAAAVALAAMAAFSVSTVAGAIDAIRPYVEGRQELYRPLRDVRFDNAVVFLPYVGAGRLVSPYALSRNEASYDGPVIWAVDRGTRLNLEVLEEFPGRVPYRLVASRGRRKSASPRPNFDARIQPVVHLTGRQVDLDLVVANPPPATTLRFVLSARAQHHSIDMPAEDIDRVDLRLPLAVGSGYVRLLGEQFAPAPPHASRLRLKITAIAIDEARGSFKAVGMTDLDVAVNADGVEILAPSESPPSQAPKPALYLTPPASAQWKP
jgi:hypothetical protein